MWERLVTVVEAAKCRLTHFIIISIHRAQEYSQDEPTVPLALLMP